MSRRPEKELEIQYRVLSSPVQSCAIRDAFFRTIADLGISLLHCSTIADLGISLFHCSILGNPECSEMLVTGLMMGKRETMKMLKAFGENAVSRVTLRLCDWGI